MNQEIYSPSNAEEQENNNQGSCQCQHCSNKKYHHKKQNNHPQNEKKEYIDPNDKYYKKLYSLPEWVLSECSGSEEKQIMRENYFLLQTANTGDCLFHSIHLCLMSIPQEDYTSFELRNGVASTVLDHNNVEALNVLEQWKIMLELAYAEGDREMQREYLHAFPLLQDQSPFSTESRNAVYNNMMNVNNYWGDQYSILVLERKLNVKFIILGKTVISEKKERPPSLLRTKYYLNPILSFQQQQYMKKSVCRARVGIKHNNNDGRNIFNPKWYFILVLEGQHYKPIAKIIKSTQITESKVMTAFLGQDIPQFVKDSFK